MRRRFLCGVLAVLLILSVSLTGCKKAEFEPENAIALWEKIDKTMDGLHSVKTDIIMDMVYYTMDYEVRMNSSGTVLLASDSYYADNHISAKCEALSWAEEVRTVEAYYDGKMYTATNDGVHDQKLCSPMAWEDFGQSKISGLFIDEIDFAACTSSEFTKEDDNTWTLQFSGYTKKSIDRVLKGMSISDTELGVTVTDMHIKVTADTNFCIQQVDISFVFAESEIQPGLTIVARYSDFDKAQIDPAKLDVEAYTQVDDVRVLDYVSQALKEKQDISEAAFTLDIRTVYKMPKESISSEEHDVVRYGRTDGAYFYSIDSKTDDVRQIVTYQNGEQSVKSNGQSWTVQQEEAEAKAFIDSLIDFARYSGISVTNIQKQETGIFVLTIEQVDLALHQPSYIPELESGTQTITVFFTDKILTGIESKTVLTASYADEPMQMTITSSVQFVSVE